MRSLHISLNTTHSECKPNSSISCLHIFSPSLPAPTHTSHPCHHHISTGWPPNHLHYLTFHMPKPPQSTMPHQLGHALNPQKTVQIHTALPILQRHPAHPSRHHPKFRPLQTLQICYLHRPGFSPLIMSIHSGHKPCISFSFHAALMHPELSGLGDDS